MRYAPLALAGCIILSACAPTVWEKPGATQAQANQDSAKCRLVARGMNSGGSYSADPHGSATGAAVSNTFGSALNTASTYQDCMVAIGYRKASIGKVATGKPPSDGFKPILDQLSACIVSIYAIPEAKPLRLHSPLNVDELTRKQLTDPAFANDAVIAAIAVVHPRVQQCQQAALTQLTDAQPALVPVIANTFAQAQRALQQFQAHRITWGAYNSERRSIAQAFRSQLADALRQ